VIPLDRVKFCSNPECRAVLPADPDNELTAGFWASKREDGRVRRFQSRCKDCVRRANRERATRRRREAGCRIQAVAWVAEYEGRMVQFRRCQNADCGIEGPCLATAESVFPVHNRGDGSLGWRAICRDCYNRQQRERRRGSSTEKMRERKREKYRKLMKDPEFVEARRAYGRQYYADHPERKAAVEEANRRRRKRNRNLRSKKKSLRNAYDACPDRGWVVQSRTGNLLAPARPFGRWLTTYQRETGCADIEIMAMTLGIHIRRVTSILGGKQEWISFDIVDRALTNSSIPGLDVTLGDGRTVEVWDIYDLYPSYPRRDYSNERG
jgi:hypothetical protein